MNHHEYAPFDERVRTRICKEPDYREQNVR